MDGHPTISHSDNSEAGIVRNISTLNDGTVEVGSSSIGHSAQTESGSLLSALTVNVSIL